MKAHRTGRHREASVGVIGGSGLYRMEGLKDAKEYRIRTPFGAPSGAVVVGLIDGVQVAFLARHGSGHRLSPSEINYRANIYALKSLGVTHIIASGAVGSLREEIRPRDLVIVDQVIDRTTRRASTFFDEGVTVHVEFSHPFCPDLRGRLIEAEAAVNCTVHERGTYVCIEGPAFSTVAESQMHRDWGADVVGMTCLPEARLAREAEICYAMVALAICTRAVRNPLARMTCVAFVSNVTGDCTARAGRIAIIAAMKTTPAMRRVEGREMGARKVMGEPARPAQRRIRTVHP